MRGYVEDGDEYNSFVARLRDRLIEAYAEVHQQLRQSAGYNKRYYDIGVRPSRFEAGQWVWYYNPRKFPGKQMKWTQQYEGPYLVLKMLSSVVAKIQQSSRTKPKVVHIDKLKKYEGVEPRMWPTAVVAVDAQRDRGQEGQRTRICRPPRRMRGLIWQWMSGLRGKSTFFKAGSRSTD